MAGELQALLRATVAPLVRWLPSWVLRRRYHLHACNRHVSVFTDGVGPHVYVNDERSPVITGMSLLFINELPFPVEVRSLNLELHMEGRTITNESRAVQETVPARGMHRLTVEDIHLSDAQVRLIQQLATDCPTLRVTGYASCASMVGEFNKTVQAETRTFVYRGRPNK